MKINVILYINPSQSKQRDNKVIIYSPEATVMASNLVVQSEIVSKVLAFKDGCN